jgi:hypothetical protein
MDVIGPDDALRRSLREMIGRLVEISGSESWNQYARAWLDGSMAAGLFVDTFTHRPATSLDFVRDAQAGATAAARSRSAQYEFARGLEDAAWAVDFLELGKAAKAQGFMASAARRTGVAA